jgi:hypothetical protein
MYIKKLLVILFIYHAVLLPTEQKIFDYFLTEKKTIINYFLVSLGGCMLLNFFRSLNNMRPKGWRSDHPDTEYLFQPPYVSGLAVDKDTNNTIKISSTYSWLEVFEYRKSEIFKECVINKISYSLFVAFIVALLRSCFLFSVYLSQKI